MYLIPEWRLLPPSPKIYKVIEQWSSIIGTRKKEVELWSIDQKTNMQIRVKPTSDFSGPELSS